jgi:hypothetical protein
VEDEEAVCIIAEMKFHGGKPPSPSLTNHFLMRVTKQIGALSEKLVSESWGSEKTQVITK